MTDVDCPVCTMVLENLAIASCSHCGSVFEASVSEGRQGPWDRAVSKWDQITTKPFDTVLSVAVRALAPTAIEALTKRALKVASRLVTQGERVSTQTAVVII